MEEVKYREKLRLYPHMFPRDIEIWERYLKIYKKDYQQFLYDVKIGSVPQFPNGLPPEIYKMGEDLWKKRIDVVGIKTNEIEVIEVKPNAGLSALGQVLGYAKIYTDEKKPSLPVYPVLITDYPKEDIPSLSLSFGVRLVIV